MGMSENWERRMRKERVVYDKEGGAFTTDLKKGNRVVE